MTQPNQNQIADRSYFIWEKEGRPEGKALDHWLQARAELEAEAAAAGNGAKPKRTRAASTKKTNGTARAKKTTGTTRAKKTPVV